jgi:hypothetical protein
MRERRGETVQMYLLHTCSRRTAPMNERLTMRITFGPLQKKKKKKEKKKKKKKKKKKPKGKTKVSVAC